MILRARRRKPTDDLLVGARTVGKRYETAINTFHRADDDRTVTLVGIEHLGELDYFAQVRKIIDELADGGAQVRLEQLQDKNGEVDKPRTDRERQALDALHDNMKTRFAVFAELGIPWVEQDEGGLAPAPEWVQSDITAMQFVRLMGPDFIVGNKVIDAPKRQLELVRSMKTAGATTRLRLLRKAIVGSAIARGDDAGGSKERYAERMVMRGFRELTESLKILDAAQHTDVAVVWNGGHHPGMAHVLTNNGFTLTDTRWLVAMEDRDFGPIPSSTS